MKILVTGGAGFIGSNVVDAYIEAGHEVVIVDNLFSGKLLNLNPRARFYLLDIRSAELKKVFEMERPEVVNHHAAQMSVPASVEDPSFDADVNVLGFINVLEAARRSGTRKVIFISSGGTVYGDPAEFPSTEACPPNPLSPYAITKMVSESYLKFYRRQYGLDYTTLRYGNIYGPRQTPHGEAGVVAIFMNRLLGGMPCTIYHFEEEPRGMLRDYCYVGDVGRANVLALDAGGAEAFNIGTGVHSHTEEIFNEVFKAIDKKVGGVATALARPSRAMARPGDLAACGLVVEKARKELGWRARTGLAEGIALTLDWRMSI